MPGPAAGTCKEKTRMARAPRRAFTLIETVMAIIILAVGVPPMLWAVSQAQNDRANPVLFSRARWLAVEKLEDIIADRHSATRGYSYLRDHETGAQNWYPDENPGDISGYPGYGRTVTMNEKEADLATDGTGYMVVDVAVTWTDTNNNAQSLAISTVLTEYTPSS
jgi:prepilin-type N-terminal cleavage/methylation domain-containing protein